VTQASLVRYCIACGRLIENGSHCTGPACGVPSFYRHVAGPGSPGSAPPVAAAASPRAVSETPRAPDDVVVAQSPPRPERRTLPWSRPPVALLESAGRPDEVHPVHPGRTEVGASPPAKIVIDAPSVSARHARIVCGRDASGEWRIGVVDHNSTNGTFVNGQRVTKSLIREGDRVRFAGEEYVLRVPQPEEARRTLSL
jgi:hypothetical protein